MSESIETAVKISTSGIRTSRKQFIAEQEKPLYTGIRSEEECAGAPVGYDKRAGVLMRKWQPCALMEGATSAVSQIAVPKPLSSRYSSWHMLAVWLATLGSIRHMAMFC